MAVGLGRVGHGVPSGGAESRCSGLGWSPWTLGLEGRGRPAGGGRRCLCLESGGLQGVGHEVQESVLAMGTWVTWLATEQSVLCLPICRFAVAGLP